MRKVLYQLNSLSEPMPGFFHCWAGTMQDAYALIEDTTTGKLHPVNCDQFRFVTPPETTRTSMEEMLIKCLTHFEFDKENRGEESAAKSFVRTVQYLIK